MSAKFGIRGFVCLLAAMAVAALVVSANTSADFPGAWAFFVLWLAGFLTGTAVTRLRVGDASGSVAFIIALALAVLFGPFWAGVLTATTALCVQLFKKNEPIKIIFNVSQQVISVMAAAAVYSLLGGKNPPGFFLEASSVTLNHVLPTLLAFYVGSVAYFVINSASVSTAVALSSNRSPRDIWRANTVWVLGYDVSASTLSLLVAWLFVWFDSSAGIQRLGFLVIMLSIFAVRHLYGKLHALRHLYDELDQAYEKLEVNVREQLEMMVKSIEARDPYTSGHSRRVAALSKAIATDLGLEAKLADEIENAALLHDVGKIHAEFAPLLSKEGRLTAEEWEIMKTHATKSAELVALFSRFQGNVLESVRWHHERWDGKGYPDGIVGEAIPLGARIIMISDTIDAMSTDRPYRKALSFEKVTSELVKYRGIQFDPNLVDVTVNSVTVRRLVSDKDFLAEQTNTIKSSSKKLARPALRSQSSFWDGLRASVGSQEP
jgi:HD-GYP domain-containing protein (c-di-GMP phosphodiesterase class II)